MIPRALVATLIGLTVSIVSLLGFIRMSTSNLAYLRDTVVVLYIGGTLILFFWLARSTNKLQVIAVALATALLSGVAEQSIGFLVFPGLVKDIGPFTAEHFQMLAFLLMILCGWYLTLAISAVVVTVFFRRPIKSI
jgi:hypothetical protein